MALIRLLTVLVVSGLLGSGAASAQVPRLEALYQTEFPVWLDYADELHPTAFSIDRVVDVGDGYQSVEISFELDNQAGAIFDQAVALPDFSGLNLEVRLDAVHAARFPAIASQGPGGTSASIESMIVELPATRLAELTTRLGSGDVPFEVLADERPQLQPGNILHRWTEGDDVAYQQGFNLDPDPFGPRPWDPADEFSARLYYPAVVPSEVLAFDPAQGSLYFAPESGAELAHLPEGFHYFVAHTVEVDEQKIGAFVTITGHITDEESLLDAYSHASFSTGVGGHIDGPVGATRLPAIDRVVLDDEDRDSKTLPIRFNDIDLLQGRVSVSGQIQGHALKPSVSVRIRPGASKIVFAVDTDLSVAAEVRAHAWFDEEEALSLYELCFPLPDLTFGPISLPMALQLNHTVTVAGSLRGGTVVGFDQRVQFGYTVTCEGDGDSITCIEDTRNPPSPVQLSPPQVTSYANAHVELGTRFDTNLWVGGSRYPECSSGFHAGLSGAVYVRADLDPLDDPWWRMGYGGSVEGSVGFDALGFSLIDHDIALLEAYEGDLRASESLPPDPADQARYLSGEDQRWMVAIDQPEVGNLFLRHVNAEPMSDGGVAVTVSEAGDYRVLRLDRFGALVWNQTYRGAPNRSPNLLAVRPDDAIVVAGTPAFAVVHEPGGEPLWASAYEITDGSVPHQFQLHGMEVVEDPGGDWGILLVGHIWRGSDDDGVLVKLRSDGTVAWAKIYDGERQQQLYGITVARNGDLVAVGTTWDGPDPFSFNNAWMTRLDPTNGAVIWSRAIVSHRRGGLLHDVVEGPGGELYAVGLNSRDVTRSGSAFVTKVDADGEHAIHALLVHDVANEAVLDFETTPPVEVSDAAYDTLSSVAVVGDGIVVAGHAGTADRTAWLARLGPKLGVEWFMVLDGAGADSFSSVSTTDDGLLVAGHSASAVPDGTENQDEHAIVAKVPFEGAMELHPEYSDIVLRYLIPGVLDSSGSDDVVPDGLVMLDSPVTVVDATVEAAISLDRDDLLQLPPKPECVQLMTVTGHPTTTDPCPDVDLFAPVVRILSPQARPYGVSEVVGLEVTLVDELGLAASEVQVDGTPMEAGAQLSMAELGLGEHLVEAYAEDGVGNIALDEVGFQVVDDVGPQVEIRSPEATTYVLGVIVRPLPIDVWHFDEHGTVVDVVTELDGVVLTTDEIDLHALELGEHLFSAGVIDDAGNVEKIEIAFRVAADDPRSCGCTHPGPGAPAWWVTLCGLLWWRRRPIGAARALRGAPD